MSKWIIRGNDTELENGTRIYVIPVTEILPDQLAMYMMRCEELEVEIIGRKIAENQILQPDRIVGCGGPVSIHEVGVVIPMEDPPKEITNLTAAEYIGVLLNIREGLSGFIN
jgi:hypothetical protein